MLAGTRGRKLISPCYAIPVVLMLMTTVSKAQDTRYFDKQGRETIADKAVISEKSVTASDNQFFIVRQKKSGDTISMVTCSSLSPVTRDGITRIFYDSGPLHYSKQYRDNKLDGEIRRYYEDGKIMSIFTFESDSLVNEKSFDTEGNPVKHISSMIPVKFRGKDLNAFRLFVAQNVRYPQFEGMGYNVSEQCPVTFRIDREGNITDIQMQTVVPQFRDEILRLMKLSEGKWTPSESFGEPVSTQCVTRIDFNSGK